MIDYLYIKIINISTIEMSRKMWILKQTFYSEANNINMRNNINTAIDINGIR